MDTPAAALESNVSVTMGCSLCSGPSCLFSGKPLTVGFIFPSVGEMLAQSDEMERLSSHRQHPGLCWSPG